VEVIEIDKTTRSFGGIVKQTQTIAHKVLHQGIFHIERPANNRLGFTIEAIEKISYINLITEITLNFQINNILKKWYAL